MGFGDFLSGVFGTSNSFQAQNPYQTDPQAQQLYDLNLQNYNQQGDLAQALLAQSQGQGPSPTSTLLGQALQQQAGSANSLAMGARGINPGLALRQAMMAQTQAGQNVTGQASVARQQEQLNAQSQLRGLYGQMGSQNLQQQHLLTGANMGAQAINANVASGNQGAASGIVGGGLNALGSLGSLFKGGGKNTDSAGIGSTDAGGPTSSGAGVEGSPGGGPTYAAHGGIIPRRMAYGGLTDSGGAGMGTGMADAGGGSSPSVLGQMGSFTDAFGKGYSSTMASQPSQNPYMGMLSEVAGVDPMIANAGQTHGGGGGAGGLGSLGGLGGLGQAGMGVMHGIGLWTQAMGSKGSGAPTPVGKGEDSNQVTPTPPSEAPIGSGYSSGGLIQGGSVPGRASVSGDSYSNDTVPTMLSPGEIVIPRSHAENAQMAKSFIDHLMSQKKKKEAGTGGYGKVLEAHRKLGQALEAVGVK